MSHIWLFTFNLTSLILMVKEKAFNVLTQYRYVQKYTRKYILAKPPLFHCLKRITSNNDASVYLPVES